jgi:esterase/lipase
MVDVYKHKTGSKNKKVVFLLAGWKSKLSAFWSVAQLLRLNGFYTITYAYESEILSPQFEQTRTAMLEVKERILKEIEELKKQGYNDFSIFGTSLGASLALMVADNSSDVRRVILNLTGSDLPKVVWEWGEKLNKEFHTYFKKHDISFEELENSWKVISPENNINNLKGKKILLFLAQKDRIIPYKFGEDFVKKLQKNNYDHILKVTPFGAHSLVGMYNFLKFKTYLDFLKDC